MPFTTDPGAKLGAVAGAIADAFSGLTDVTVLSYEPIGSEIPTRTICVGAHESSRTEIDEAEQRLGRDDWDDEWSVTLYIRVEDAEAAWTAGRSLLGQMTSAIDFDVDLGGEVQEARLVSSSLALDEADQGPRLLIGTCTVAVRYLMPDPT